MSRIRNWLNNELYPQISPQVEEMRSVWSELGESNEDQENEILEAMQEAEQIMQRIMERKLRRLHVRREQLLDQSEKYAKRINELGRLLDIEDVEPEEGLKLIQLENCLRERVEELEHIHEERATRLKNLRAREQSAAALLGERPIVIPDDLLTESILENVQKRCDFLDDERTKRQQKLSTTREKILLLMDELERKPETSFEKDLMFESEHVFQLTQINMNGVENLASKLNEDLKRNQTEANRCRETIHQVWEFLQVDHEYRESFMDLQSGHRPSTIEALKNEISRCRQLKLEKASQFIEKVRMEIREMWGRCYYSSQQRRAFKAYYVEELTEELLEAHDNELQRLQDVFAAGQPVYEVFRKRADIWEKMLKFEKPTDDPERLNNRGGRLLREERERKKLMILFPKLEAELEKVANEWEAEHKHRFLVFGVPVMDYIRDQWDAHRQEKENEKFERLRAKAKKIEDELVNGSRANVSRKRVNCTPGKENPRKVVRDRTVWSDASRGARMLVRYVSISLFDIISVQGQTTEMDMPRTSVLVPREMSLVLFPVTPNCAGALFHPVTSASKTALSGRPPTSAVKMPMRKTRVLPRRLVTQQSRIACERTTRASPSDTLLAQADSSRATSTILGASHLSTYSEFTKNINRKCRIDNRNRSSALTPQPSPGTPRRYMRDRLGLPFLL